MRGAMLSAVNANVLVNCIRLQEYYKFKQVYYKNDAIVALLTSTTLYVIFCDDIILMTVTVQGLH